MLECQILVCSTQQELPWLNACLRSVQKYWKGGVSPITVLTPECRNSLPSVLTELESYVVFQPSKMHDYIRMTADSYLSAPIVLFLDVHELFIRDCNLSTFTDDMQRPTLTTEVYSSHMNRPCADQNSIDGRRWTIDDTLGMYPEYEFTSRDPVLFYRHSIRRTRLAIQAKTKRPLESLVRDCVPEYFSPPNFIGEFCFERENASYNWIPATSPYEATLQCFWGITDVTKGEDFRAVQKILGREEEVYPYQSAYA